MLKRFVCLMAALFLLLPSALAAPQDLIETAKSHLTEVYGYTAEDADNFQFSDDKKGTLSFWPKDRPEWIYTLVYSESGVDDVGATTPFYSGLFLDFPGENDIRWVLNAARQNGWFQRWDRAAMAAFRQALREAANIRVSAALAVGLNSGTITASQAVEGFFQSCLGEPCLWTPAARQWRDWVLKEAGLAPEAPYTPPDGLAVTVNSRHSGDFIITHFKNKIPEALKPAFSHPKLAGWACLGGVIQEHQQGGRAASGVAGFEKEGRRLLVMLFKDKNGPWQAVPVGENALYPNRDIRFSLDSSFYRMRIEYPLAGGELETFVLLPTRLGQGIYACAIDSYLHINFSPGRSLQAQHDVSGWRLVETLPDGYLPHTGLENAAVFGFLDAVPDISAFPATPEAWFKAAEGRLIPEDCTMLMGANLRQNTSSRSASLGEFSPGTLARVLGYEKGDPFPWLHVRIGGKTGFVSTSYVCLPESRHGNAVSATPPLPVARAKKDLALKSGTGLFDRNTAELPEGTKMHVLCRQGGWLYVSVPRGEAGWLMDVEGRYGYVRAGDVSLAATALQLDWAE